MTSTTDRINDRAAGLRAEGLSARGVVADLTDEQQVARLPEHVDVLVNNAGMVSIGTDFESGRLTEMTLDTWRAASSATLIRLSPGQSPRPAGDDRAAVGTGGERHQRDGASDGDAR